MTQVLEAPETNGRVKIPAPLFYFIVAILGWVASAFIGYTAAANAMNARVSVLETQFQALHEDLASIKADVKTLLQRH